MNELQRSSGSALVEVGDRPLAPFLQGNGPLRSSAPQLTRISNDVEGVLAWLREYEQSAHTLRSYRAAADRLLLWAARVPGKGLTELLREDYQDFQAFLMDPQPAKDWISARRVERSSPDWRPFRRKMTPPTAAQTMAAVGSLLSFLVDAGYLSGNPLGLRRTRDVVRNTHVDRYIPLPAWELVRHTLDEQFAQDQIDRAEYERRRWLLSLMYLTGMRREEVARHQQGAFFVRWVGSTASWWIKIFGKGRHIDEIPACKDLMAALRRYRAFHGWESDPAPGESRPLIGREKNPAEPIGPDMIYLVLRACFRSAAERTDDPSLRRILTQASPHWMRHTHLTRLLEETQDLKLAQKSGRHRSLQTTQNYVHPEDDRWRAAVDLVRSGW